MFDREKDEDYIRSLVGNSYNISRANVSPFTANFKDLVNKLSPNKNLFFGNFSINLRAYFVKNPAFLNPIFFPDLFSSFRGVPQVLLASSSSVSGFTSSTEVINYTAMLFDDLVVQYNTFSGYSSWLTAPNIGSVVGQPGFVVQSLSNITPGGNDVYNPNFWLTKVAANTSFIYAPEILYFSGYIVSINI